MADFQNKNVDFTNGRPYNQAEHRRALDSCWGSYINSGLDFTGNASTCSLTGGSGICKGYPFQFEGNYSTSKSGTYYIYVKITATIDSDNLGTADGNIMLTSNSNLLDSIDDENNQTLYFKIYKIVNGAVDTDYRHQQTLKSVKLKETSNQWGLTVNGVDSNMIDKPPASLPDNITGYESTGWVNYQSGIYGGVTINLPSGTNLWDYDTIGFSYNGEPNIFIDLEKLRALGSIPQKGSTTTYGYLSNAWGGKMDATTTQFYVLALKLYKNKIQVVSSSVFRITNGGVVSNNVNNGSYAFTKYCLLKRKY